VVLSDLPSPGFAKIGCNAPWGPGAPRVDSGLAADTFELLFPSGKRELLLPG
jgi:hypothetical protein